MANENLEFRSKPIFQQDGYVYVYISWVTENSLGKQDLILLDIPTTIQGKTIKFGRV